MPSPAESTRSPAMASALCLRMEGDVVVLGQQLVNGLALGGVYALITIGYSLVFSILRFMNFAHGDVYMFGSMFIGVMIVSKGMNPVVAVPLGILLGAVIAMLVERVAYKPLRTEAKSVSMVTAVGAAMIIRDIAEVLWESRTRPFPPLMGDGIVEIVGLRITAGHLGVFAVTLCVLALFNSFLRYTKPGKSILFVSQDLSTAALMGIPVDRVITGVYALGGALGVVGGVLFGSIYNSVYPWMGFSTTMKAFTAAIIGGIGNVTGATVGGFILGVIEVLASGYISTAYRDAISFSILIVVLLVKPSGIFGSISSEQERV